MTRYAGPGMKLICSLLGHVPATEGVTNEEISFSWCARCEQDLIRRRPGQWAAPPRGVKVVWPRGAADEAAAHPVPPVTADKRGRRNLVNSETADRPRIIFIELNDVDGAR